MQPEQDFIFHVLLFFMRVAGKEVGKFSLISTLCALCCQLSESADTNDTKQAGGL